MLPPELLTLIGNGAIAGIFAWLYVDLKKRYEELLSQRDKEIARLYDLRIFEIKTLANLPTDIEGDYKLPAKAA
jgi:hypothetical protein